MQILRVFARVYTDDLDSTLDTFAVAGIEAAPDRRFAIPSAGVEVGVVGDVVVVAGSDTDLEPFRATDMTWLVDDLDAAMAQLAPRTLEVIRAPREVPTGRNATLRLTGIQVELVQWSD